MELCSLSDCVPKKNIIIITPLLLPAVFRLFFFRDPFAGADNSRSPSLLRFQTRRRYVR